MDLWLMLMQAQSGLELRTTCVALPSISHLDFVVIFVA